LKDSAPTFAFAMALFLIIGLLVGATLALRCRVFVLVPATLMALVTTIIASTWLGDPIGQSIIIAVVTAAAVEFGYLLMSAFRAVAAGAAKPIANNPLRLSDAA
jgi:hypothetical protein